MKYTFYFVLLFLVCILDGCVIPLGKDVEIVSPTIENKKYVIESALELADVNLSVGTNVTNQFNEFSFYFKNPSSSGGFTVLVECSCSQFGSNYSSSSTITESSFSYNAFGFVGLSSYWDTSGTNTYFRFTDDTFKVIELRARLSRQSCWGCYKHYLIKLRRVD